ncbi:hypothetical protein PYW07_015736 [Mythimna separata]|uniref:RNase H type-1 domain-containing protein n=2 Tax=Mythimna separata TaxID=271217 RepID=A0AAD7YQN4_MYTSE|nr:hypothetical protein PYW07_015736 [Mythimna separata]
MHLVLAGVLSVKEKRASGSWSSTELKFQINYLELKAAFLGLQCFAKDFQNCELLHQVDNTSAVAYINKMGGVQFKHLNSITRELWQWCEKRNIWVFASYMRNAKDESTMDWKTFFFYALPPFSLILKMCQ